MFNNNEHLFFLLLVYIIIGFWTDIIATLLFILNDNL